MTGKRIHLVGIGGVGMAGLAVLLKDRGHAVTGCDLKATPRTRWLEAQGIAVAIGHDPAHVRDADGVIITPAVAQDNPELRVCAPSVVRRRGEVLAEIVNERPDTIAVCGSHGKTTTATWIARLLAALGEDVAWCIGGETGAFPVAHAAGGPLVVEADESDGTLELYHARTLVVNRCDYDHPDHFPTFADYLACYERAKRNAGDVIDAEGLDLAGWDFPVIGEHNRRNARAAVEVALRRGHSREAILAVLPQAVAALPDRRFELLAVGAGEDDPPRVYTDYAHHPTEMRCAVGMARQVCRGRLTVLFQPHRYSRTRSLLADFPAAFAEADEVVLCPTYAAFERPVSGGDIADLYAAVRAHFVSGRPEVRLARSCAEVWTHACNRLRPGDVTLLLGAGDIIDLAPQVRADLALPPTARRAAHPARRFWLGMGSNTWRSDLDIGEEYVRTEGPAGRPGVSLLKDPAVGPRIPWMVGIPGTIGGWVKMNAGAFGHSISEVIARVKVDGRWIAAAECGFRYRHSDIRGEIQDVEWNDAPVVSDCTAEEYLASRRKFPAHTWGSFFKNPEGDFAGRLLESVGAKGMRVGGAYVWEGHANVIVAGEGATPSDVLALARLMHWRVRHACGVALEPEVRGIVVD